MFGDFSRFDNDPEVGLNGIYLSQGSPILDSDWNEQVAALTDWITVVGRLAAGDTLRRQGFWLQKKSDTAVTVSSGFGLLSGRAVQSCREYEFQVDSIMNSRVRGVLKKTDAESTYSIYLVASERQFTGPNVKDDLRNKSTGQIATDWRILVSEKPIEGGVTAADEKTNMQIEYVSPARSLGESAHLTPRLRVSWGSPDSTFKGVASSSTLCILECDVASGRDETQMRFKLASSPQNTFLPQEWMPEPVFSNGNESLTYSGTGCVVLDLLKSPSSVWIEKEDDESIFDTSAALFRNLGSVVSTRLRHYKYDPAKRSLEPVNFHHQIPKGQLINGDRVKVWNQEIHSESAFPFVMHADQKGDDIGVRGQLINSELQTLIPGDRWYIPIENGMPVARLKDIKEGIVGHRVFRAIAMLGTVKVKDGTIIEVKNLASNNLSALTSTTPPTDSQLESVVTSRNQNHDEVLQSPKLQIYPVAHRLDDSLHRLTGALNAARSLTRQTPCKELTTRVSYLPLRRWLASAYVHEIADLDLDGFLAKVRRSIDVAPEDEHRFREQAGLILDEANQLAGSITPRPKSDTNRESDTMVSTPTDNSHPMSLGSATRDALQQAFTQEIPRA